MIVVCPLINNETMDLEKTISQKVDGVYVDVMTITTSWKLIGDIRDTYGVKISKDMKVLYEKVAFYQKALLEGKTKEEVEEELNIAV